MSLLSELVIYVSDRKEEALTSISPGQTRYILYINFLIAYPVILNPQKLISTCPFLNHFPEKSVASVSIW